MATQVDELEDVVEKQKKEIARLEQENRKVRTEWKPPEGRMMV